MLSNWLLWSLALVAAAAAGVLLALSTGLGGTAAAALAALLIFLVSALPVAVTYGFALRDAYAPPADLQTTAWRAWRAAALEWLATLALFVVFQPFARWWMGREALEPGRPGQPPLLLIHGYFCNRGVWWWLRRGLRAHGRAVAILDLEPPLASIEDLAEGVAARIESLAADSDAGQVVLVGHSMGGLAARAYLRRHGSSRVAKLITLGTPHHGTELARLGLGRNARQMERGSTWIRELAEAEPPPVPTLSVWSARDNYVMPQDSSRLAGTRENVLPALGHLSMLFSPKILEILLDETEEPTPSP